jgi:hypothetical protein
MSQGHRVEAVEEFKLRIAAIIRTNPEEIESITIRLPTEFLKVVRYSLFFQAARIFANQ